MKTPPRLVLPFPHKPLKITKVWNDDEVNSFRECLEEQRAYGRNIDVAKQLEHFTRVCAEQDILDEDGSVKKGL